MQKEMWQNQKEAVLGYLNLFSYKVSNQYEIIYETDHV